MVLATLSFRLLPHKRAEVLSAMDVVLERMRQRPGCLRSRLLADVEDPCAFVVASEWHHGEAAAAFFDSHDLLVVRGIRILLRDDPIILFDDVQTRVKRLLRSS